MASENRQPIGYVTATVKFPLYEGDKIAPLNPGDKFTSADFPWFEFREPGITPEGVLGVCTRKCETLSVSVT